MNVREDRSVKVKRSQETIVKGQMVPVQLLETYQGSCSHWVPLTKAQPRSTFSSTT